MFGAECSPRHLPAPLFLRHFQDANAHTVRLTKGHQAATAWAFCGRPRSAGLPLVPNTESLPRANRAFPVQNPDLGPCAPRKMLSPKATAYGPAQLQNGPFGNSGLSQVRLAHFESPATRKGPLINHRTRDRTTGAVAHRRDRPTGGISQVRQARPLALPNLENATLFPDRSIASEENEEMGQKRT